MDPLPKNTENQNMPRVVDEPKKEIQPRLLILGIIALLLGTAATILYGSKMVKQESIPTSSNSGTEVTVSSPSALIESMEIPDGSPAAYQTPTRAPARTGNSVPTIKPSPTQAANSPTPSPTQVAAGTMKLYANRTDGQSAAQAAVDIGYPGGSAKRFFTDNSGYLAVNDLKPGYYTIDVYYGGIKTSSTFSIGAGQITGVHMTVPVPAPTATPTPIPDTQAPVLTGFSGPFEQTDGTCVILYASQIQDNQQTSNFCVNWSMDGVWSGWYTKLAYKCYTDLTPGVHTITAKVKDEAGNISNEISVTFTK